MKLGEEGCVRFLRPSIGDRTSEWNIRILLGMEGFRGGWAVNVRIGIYWLTAPEAVLKGGSDCARNYLEVRVCFTGCSCGDRGFSRRPGTAGSPADSAACQRTTFTAGACEGRPSLHVQGGCGAGCVDAEGAGCAAL